MSGSETLHIVALPHTETTSHYLTCAYTQKVIKFCKMMSAQGRRVILYSGVENEAVCAEHVACVAAGEREEWFGPWDHNGLFGNVDWDPAATHWATMNARVIAGVRHRMRPRDFLCLTAGWSQKPIADALESTVLPVEWAVGYEGIALKHRVFESYAWMHHVYGLKGIRDGAAFDAVIPNFFDVDDFPDTTIDEIRNDYLLFVGRVVARKGPHVAAEIAKRVGMQLVIAGPGGKALPGGGCVAPEITIEDSHVDYVGPVGKAMRAALMRQASAVIVPTQYIEPFGGVAVEAMLCGTPVIATDWGAFPETVIEGVTGARFRTAREGVAAFDRAMRLPGYRIRRYAMSHFSLDAVGPQFEKHFERLATLWGEGWYA